MPKIAIGMPTAGAIKTKTVSSLARMFKKIPYEWYFLTQESSIIQLAREDIVKKAIELNCSHLLFIDSDMAFESNALDELLACKKEIIGAECHLKKIPPEVAAKGEDPDGAKVWIDYGNGLIECCGAGLAFTLIDLSVFKKISHPWFFFQPDNDGKIKYGEDMWFCRKAREAGFKIWLNTKVKIKHIGNFEY